MKYVELQNKNIDELNERTESLGFELSDLKQNIQELKENLGEEMMEHELVVFRYQQRVEQLRNSLYQLLNQKETLEETYSQAQRMLDQSRFNAFRDDRGESVESLPIGPLAIVPLGNSGVTPPNVEWDDEDSPHLKDKKPDLIDFKECCHKRFEGPFIKYAGTYTCNNCKTQEVACFECRNQKKD